MTYLQSILIPGGDVETAVEVDRADHGLDGVGHDRGLVAPAGRLLPAAEQQVAQLTHERDTARAEVAAVRSSLSWRVTTPLRHLGLRSVLRRVRR